MLSTPFLLCPYPPRSSLRNCKPLSHFLVPFLLFLKSQTCNLSLKFELNYVNQKEIIWIEKIQSGHTHARAHTHTDARTHTRIHAHTRTHACDHERTHAHTYVTCTHAHTRTHAHTHTHTHIHTRAHTHIHTHTRRARKFMTNELDASSKGRYSKTHCFAERFRV